jgi:tetratricopeptide (TPR) repeat protein
MNRAYFSENKTDPTIDKSMQLNFHEQKQHAVPITIGSIRPLKNNIVRMKKAIFLLVISLVSVIAAFGADLQKQMQEGNTLCKKGQYDKAIATYEGIIKTGYTSADLYFNLGYTYFKAKNINKAILNFERAKLLAPSDKDITYNLEFARSFTVDKIEVLPEVFLVTWFKSLRNMLNLSNWTFLSIVFFLGTLILFLIFLLSQRITLKKAAFWTGIVVFIFWGWSFGCAYSHYNAQTNKNTAIVFTPIVNIKSTPAETGNNLFILHEGTKVEIIDKVDDWCEIKISSGGRGFIKISDLEII